MSLKTGKENPLEANMHIFSNEIMQVKKMIDLKIYTNPLDIEKKIKELDLQYEEGILQLLRSGGLDENIEEARTINNLN